MKGSEEGFREEMLWVVRFCLVGGWVGSVVVVVLCGSKGVLAGGVREFVGFVSGYVLSFFLSRSIKVVCGL